MTQPQVRLSQTVLQLGHDEAVADCLPLQLGGRLIQPLPEDRPQRPAFLLLRHRVEVFEHRAEDANCFLDLGQPFLRQLFSHPLTLGASPRRPSGLLGSHQADGRADDASRQRHQQQTRRQHRPPVPPDELSQAIAGAGRARFDWLVVQVSVDVACQAVSRLVAPVAILLERLHHDPVQLAAHLLGQARRLEPALRRNRGQRVPGITQPGAGLWRLLLANQPQYLRHGCQLEPLARERSRAGQKLVEQHAQTVDIGAGIDIHGIEFGLLGAHIFERTDDAAEARDQGPFRQLLPQGLGHAEVDHLGHGLAVVGGDQDIGRFEVAVDDPFLVGVLHGLANLHKQGEPLSRRELMLVAEPGDGDALDELHDEVGSPGGGLAAVQDAGNADVLHESQGLALGLEAGDHLTRVHARLQDFQSDPAANRVLLLGHEYHAEAAFPDLLDQFVGANQRAYALTERGIDGPLEACDRGIEESCLARR